MSQTTTDSLPVLRIEPLFPDVIPPRHATAHSAGYDVHAYLHGRIVERYSSTSDRWEAKVAGGRIVLAPGERALVPLGFRATLPPGFEAQVRPRSGWALKSGLTVPNSPGTIDADYNGEWCVIVMNSSNTDIEIGHGERIAQVVFNRYERMDFYIGEVGRSTERDGGFGSTGRG
jgi:dUTP pyrophosphatase